MSGELGLLERRPPWLLALADGDAVARALAARVPELSSGELELRACAFERLRIRERAQTTVHRITVAGGDGERELELHGELVADPPDEPLATSDEAFAGAGWRCHLPELRLVVRAQPAGAAVAAPSELTDPAAARELLERAIRESPAHSDLRIAAATPRVLGEKGARATVRYDLSFRDSDGGDGGPTPVIVKTYRRDKSRKVYEAMASLWSELGASPTVSVAEPLALIPELNAFVQGPVRGDRTLHELLLAVLANPTAAATAELSNSVAATAAGLAALHACGAQPDETLTWADELAEIRELLRALSALAPEAAGAVTPLLARLEALAGEHPPDGTVPSHGSFRANQVLLDDGRVGFVDFDGFCLAEPARDLSLFRTALRDVGLRPLADIAPEAREERLVHLDGLADTFLARYEAARPVSRTRVALWEALDQLTLVLYCWTKLEPGLEHRLALLRRHLDKLPL